MEDSKNLSIGILSVTAIALFVGVLLVTTAGQNKALAIGQTDRGGDYIAVTGQFTQNTELVYVMDAATRRLNAYSYDTTRREIVFWDSQDLGRLFGAIRR
ncbi:MAG: hypothetical protein JXQ75_19240 [Phycisphaerae bacterium]|nr:hypothetical protein [Phycisphaerae bacterium]